MLKRANTQRKLDNGFYDKLTVIDGNKEIRAFAVSDAETRE